MQATTVTQANSPSTGDKNAPPVHIVPFTQASLEHIEPASIDTTNTPTTNTLNLGPYPIPAYGFLRSLLILVEATAGTGTAAVYQADSPWTILQEIAFTDLNGSPIVLVSGYELYLMNKWGGYAFNADPVVQPEYVTPATNGNYSFMLRLPLEIGRRDGLGSLPNMNAAAQYQLRLTMGNLIAVYSTNPTGIPTVRIRVWAEEWSPVPATSADGSPNAVQPPAIGTTSFWSRYFYPVNAGQNTVQIRRVGNLWRNLVVVARTAAGARSDSVWPDPIQIYWDGRLVFNSCLSVQRRLMRERYGVAPDTGVLVYDLMHDFDGHPGGGELRDLYYATAQSSRIEIQGSFGLAGTVGVLVNDVAPAGRITTH